MTCSEDKGWGMLSEPLDPYSSGQEGVRAPPHSHPPRAASCKERKQRKWGWGRARGTGRMRYLERRRVLLEKNTENSEIDVPLTQAYGQHSQRGSKPSRAGSGAWGEGEDRRKRGWSGKGGGGDTKAPLLTGPRVPGHPRKAGSVVWRTPPHSPDHSDGRLGAERSPRALPAPGPTGT